MAKKSLIHRLVILGLGLIGGSLAKAAKERGLVTEVWAWGHREASLKTGLSLGIIDHYSLELEDVVTDADVIVICTPTQISEGVLQRLAQIGVAESVITDVASVKGNLLAMAENAFGAVPDNLVLAHPIAGSEQSGVAAAKSELFEKHRIILTPTGETNPTALEIVRNLWKGVGGDVVEMGVEDHDHVLAATSHLPHVLAYALVDALVTMEGRREVFPNAAGGLRDFTRIASSSPQMWQEIVLANREAILDAVNGFLLHLTTIKQHIETGDAEAILETFTRAKGARDDFAALLAQQNENLEP